MQPLFKKWHVPTCSASCQRDFQSELTVFAPKEAQFLKIIPHDSRHRGAVALLNSTFFFGMSTQYAAQGDYMTMTAGAALVCSVTQSPW